LGALWAVGLRTQDVTVGDIESALADKTILRTWLMRGTLHFVAATDVRWMLELLAPRNIASSAGRSRQLDLDEATFARSRELLTGVLQGGKHMTRSAIYELFETAHISTFGQRGYHILWRLAQEGLICFGAPSGKQQTFTLLAEWAPAAKSLDRTLALAELARRYFASHGPATLQDFTWWSGLTTLEAKAGLELANSHLEQAIINGQVFWFASYPPSAAGDTHVAYLLPAFDEYTVAYKDRSAVLDSRYAKQTLSGNGISRPVLVINGQVVGTWKRAVKIDSVVITPAPFRTLTKAEDQALVQAAGRYAAFLNLPV
jgi:hypothetical protein